MNKFIITIAACTIFASCSQSLVQHDEFTNTTTVRSEWLDSQPANPLEFLKISALYEKSANGTLEYGLDVAVGTPQSDNSTPHILFDKSLQILVDNKPLFFSTSDKDIKRSTQPGLFMVWNIEQARYRGISREELLSIARGKEVKLKVSCQSIQAQYCILSQKTKNEILKFAEKEVK